MTRTIKGTVIAATFGANASDPVGSAFEAEVDGPDDGQAVELVIEAADGRMWVYSPDFATQVNFCPFTGRKAVTQIDPDELTA